MWICLNDAFLSIVRKGGKPGELCVRARRREHIARVFPGAAIVAGAGTDYPFRAFIAGDEVARVITDRLLSIDYNNFKNSTAGKCQDLAKAYGLIWHVMLRLQAPHPDE